MKTCLSAKKAAQYIKKRNPKTMIGERTIHTLVKQGFPCLRIDSRTLINADTFEADLEEFVKNSRKKMNLNLLELKK